MGTEKLRLAVICPRTPVSAWPSQPVSLELMLQTMSLDSLATHEPLHLPLVAPNNLSSGPGWWPCPQGNRERLRGWKRRLGHGCGLAGVRGVNPGCVEFA